MTQPLFLRLALGFATLACVAWLPAAAGAVVIDDVFDFKGTVTDIGVQRGPGQIGGIEYRIEGKFEYPDPLDLTNSTITFHNLFDESLPGGNGEMVLTTDNANLICPDPAEGCVLTEPGVVSLLPLVSARSSKKTEAKYETVGRFRPPMRVQIKNKNGEYQFNVRLDRGMSPQVQLEGEPNFPYLFLDPDRQFPRLCDIDPLGSKRKLTVIRTSFTISDGKNEPVVIDIQKYWECAQTGRYHLRSR